MEHEHAVGEVVGLHGARKVEHVIDGTREYTYVDDQLVLFIDRDPKYKLDLGAINPEIAVDNPYIKVFIEEGIRQIVCCDKHDNLRPQWGQCSHALFDGCDPCCWKCPEWVLTVEDSEQ